MLTASLEFFLGLLYANAGEWLLHKYVLHALGSKPGSFWAYHWHEHHAASTRNGMLDPGYRHINLKLWNTQSKELAVLAGIILLHLPLAWLFPLFVAAVYASLAAYYYKHRRAHLDPEWARRHLRWHYDHHLGKNPNANWCVTWPWFDHLLGTRVCSAASEQMEGAAPKRQE